MTIKTCDMCGEPVGAPAFSVSFIGDRYYNFDLCGICALPIAEFLRENQLVKQPFVKYVAKPEPQNVS